MLWRGYLVERLTAVMGVQTWLTWAVLMFASGMVANIGLDLVIF